ncbi:Potassium channel subfamily K member protein [Echinococcus granulosus]|uniref:Potassium channel subfamily K 8 n=1 Tax=Echinococcus granulosus TaxID=6210 RepID=U6IXI2_ECHGR|nr:Potassium channel subfamily K member protein [Echinococcus granulosus]EUB64695.1 Potassium channel subfamily K member protein [Echinococcus granulosus]CDS16429.1 potassium channel subfamily K 8 [Echinococcus granulosus]
MLGAANNYDYGFEASLACEVLDADGKPVNKVVEDNYSRDITRCFQKTIKVLTSAVGTLILLCLYLIAGACLFRYLEQGNELEACYSTYALYREKLNTSVLRATGIVNSGLSKDVVAMQLENSLIDFAEALFALDFPPSRNCSNILEPFGSKWNWVNALYFCATVVTTIGYGHVAPTTQWGRLVCVFYCILGIPLLLIYLGSIGQMLAYLFRLTYMNICCCRCFRDTWIRRRNKRHLRLIRLQEDLRRHMELQAKLRGEPIPPPRMTPMVFDDDSDEDDEVREIYREFQDTEDAGIPITIVMLVILGYVTVGALLFHIWETDWTPIDGAYFAVITISTIGFGDLVPGNGRFDKPETITELLVGALYCVVGLALLSMCFELMKEEFVDKVQWIGQSLRIVSREGDNKKGEIDEETSGARNFRDDAKDASDHTISTFANSEMPDGMEATTSSLKSRRDSRRHSGNLLRPASSQLRKPVCVLRSRSEHCSLRSRSLKQHHQLSRPTSINSAKKDEKTASGADDYKDFEMDTGGEDNDAFGGDMTAEEDEGENEVLTRD